MATVKRGRKAAAKDLSNPAAKLIAALKFVGMAQEKIGPVHVQHCILRNHWAVGFNEVLTIGTKIEEDLDVCPHTFQFLDALSKAHGEQVIAQESDALLSVQAGDFRALVACADPTVVQIGAPDTCIAAIDDRVSSALDHVACLAIDGAPNANHAAILLQAGSAVATNGHALLEYWHGTDLPPGLLIPKKSAQAIVKAKKPLVGFGYSQTSATFWFEDGSFIKTQLFENNYPNYKHVLDVPLNPWPMPAGFFTAVHAIESFSENGVVYFDKGVMASSMSEHRATTYKVEGLTEDMAFDSKYLILLEAYFKTAHFDPKGGKVLFFGEGCRGALAGIDLKDAIRRREEAAEYRKRPPQPNGTPISKQSFDDMDDEIPF